MQMCLLGLVDATLTHNRHVVAMGDFHRVLGVCWVFGNLYDALTKCSSLTVRRVDG
jgi:hypothetical protein